MPFDDEDSWWDERMPYPPNWNQKKNANTTNAKKEIPMSDNKTTDYVCNAPNCGCKPTQALLDKQKIAFLMGICSRTVKALERKGLGDSYTLLGAFAVESLETVKLMPPDVIAEGDEATDELIDNAKFIVADPSLRACALMATELMAGR